MICVSALIWNTLKKLQEAFKKIEECSYKWGFKFSVDKTKTMFFTRKSTDNELKLKLYNQDLGGVKHFEFLGLWFNERITWAVHIQKVVDKCKKVLNVMRCLVGSKWGGQIVADCFEDHIHHNTIAIIHISIRLWLCSVFISSKHAS